ncbi:MAG: hypothetical protein K6C06_09950, partial [Lachnospiraceae bacterium]|nr:hypothetical protein [Lachnospiraceae bacterium]
MDKRKHRILDHPVLSYFLLAIFVSLIEELLGGAIDIMVGRVIPDYAVETLVMGQTTDLTMGVGVAAAALLAAWLFKL